MKAQFEAAGFSSVELVPSGGGVFEISRNGVLRYSKKVVGRFPTEQEVATCFR
ncbi:MAG: Rdx family protein [Burkholderiaceae bacterium]